MGLAFANQVRDCGHVDQNLEHRNSSAAIRARQQGLRHHAAQTLGQHHANLRLLRFRKHVNDAVHGFHRAVRVQRTKNQMTGFGCGDRQRNRFQVAHFTNQYDVRILTQRRAQGATERLRVAGDFALIDMVMMCFCCSTLIE